MTEEEAKEKWCPFGHRKTLATFASFGSTSGEDVNVQLIDEPLERARCIASQCMAWRWSRVMPVGPENYDLVDGYWKPKIKMGFCGLAGNCE